MVLDVRDQLLTPRVSDELRRVLSLRRVAVDSQPAPAQQRHLSLLLEDEAEEEPQKPGAFIEAGGIHRAQPEAFIELWEPQIEPQIEQFVPQIEPAGICHDGQTHWVQHFSFCAAEELEDEEGYCPSTVNDVQMHDVSATLCVSIAMPSAFNSVAIALEPSLGGAVTAADAACKQLSLPKLTFEPQQQLDSSDEQKAHNEPSLSLPDSDEDDDDADCLLSSRSNVPPSPRTPPRLSSSSPFTPPRPSEKVLAS